MTSVGVVRGHCCLAGTLVWKGVIWTVRSSRLRFGALGLMQCTLINNCCHDMVTDDGAGVKKVPQVLSGSSSSGFPIISHASDQLTSCTETPSHTCMTQRGTEHVVVGSTSIIYKVRHVVYFDKMLGNEKSTSLWGRWLGFGASVDFDTSSSEALELHPLRRHTA